MKKNYIIFHKDCKIYLSIIISDNYEKGWRYASSHYAKDAVIFKTYEEAKNVLNTLNDSWLKYSQIINTDHLILI